MTADSTASRLAAGRKLISEIKAAPGHGEVIPGDPVRPFLPVWLSMALVGTLSMASAWWGDAIYYRHARAEAFTAGQANGACRIWVQAVGRDPILAVTADGKALNVKCAAVLDGTMGAHR